MSVRKRTKTLRDEISRLHNDINELWRTFIGDDSILSIIYLLKEELPGYNLEELPYLLYRVLYHRDFLVEADISETAPIEELEAEITRLQAENARLERACRNKGDWNLIFDDPSKNGLLNLILEKFNDFPDEALEEELRFLPPDRQEQVRLLRRRLREVIIQRVPKKDIDGAVIFKISTAGELKVEWIEGNGARTTKTISANDHVALSRLLQSIRIKGPLFFDKGPSAADWVLGQMSKPGTSISSNSIVFTGDLSQTSADSLKAFLAKTVPSIKRLHFENISNDSDDLLSDELIAAAGQLDGLIVLPKSEDSELHNINIGDKTLLSMVDAEKRPLYSVFVGCSEFTPEGIRDFIKKWVNKEKWKVELIPWNCGYRDELIFYKCANVTPTTVEAACGDLLEKEKITEGDALSDDRISYSIESRTTNRRLRISFHFDSAQSSATVETDIGRLEEEYSILWKTLKDVNGKIEPNCLTANLPEQQLNGSLEDLLNESTYQLERWRISVRSLTYRTIGNMMLEAAQLHVEISRLRRVLYDVNGRIFTGHLKDVLIDNFLEQFADLPDRPLEQILRFLPAHQVVQMRHLSRRFNSVIKKSSKTLPKKRIDKVAFSYRADKLSMEWMNNRGFGYKKEISKADTIPLSELLRFIRIDELMFFGEGVSAADWMLDQLSKPWLAIRPEQIVFAGDLSQTSADPLKAFLHKMQGYVKQLIFQEASNISDELLSDELIATAGRLVGLLVLPSSSDRCNINIGDKTLLSMADAGTYPSYFYMCGCSGFTPTGIRYFIEKWMKRERPRSDDSSYAWELCELTFYNCANVTREDVEAACSDLDKFLMADGFSVDHGATNRTLRIFFHLKRFQCQFLDDPRPKAINDLNDIDYDFDDDDEDSDEDNDEDDYNAED